MVHKIGEKQRTPDDLFIENFRILSETIYSRMVEKGFWPMGIDAVTGVQKPTRNFGEAIALCHTELSECLEGHRKGSQPDEHCPDFKTTEVELADLVIRVMDLAAGFRLRVGEALIAKMNFNKTRPKKHGKKY